MGILSEITLSNICMLDSNSKLEVLKELVVNLGQTGKIKNVDNVFKAVIIRENQGSTGLGQGIAIPHAKSDDVLDVAIMIGISNKGIDFDSLDNAVAKVLFLIVANSNSASSHIEALSEIARLSRNETLIAKLGNAKNKEEVLALLNSNI